MIPSNPICNIVHNLSYSIVSYTNAYIPSIVNKHHVNTTSGLSSVDTMLKRMQREAGISTKHDMCYCVNFIPRDFPCLCLHTFWVVYQIWMRKYIWPGIRISLHRCSTKRLWREADLLDTPTHSTTHWAQTCCCWWGSLGGSGTWVLLDSKISNIWYIKVTDNTRREGHLSKAT